VFPRRFLLSVALFTLGAALPLGAAVAADEGPQSETAFTRVFYLQEMEVQEAMRLLRIAHSVRNIAAVGSSTLIVLDHQETIEQCERTLTERGALLRSVEPHEPRSWAPDEDTPTETRVFEIAQRASVPTIMTVLRSIYGLRDLEVSADETSIEATANSDLLDQVEAMLNELDALGY